MLKKTDKFLIQSILLFFVIVFTAMTASAACSPAELANLSCVELGGYELRIDTSLSPFPDQDTVPGSTYFRYTLVPTSTSKNVSNIAMLVPVCRDNNTIEVYTGDPNGWTAYDPGEGSSSTGFGSGVFQYYVFEQTFDAPGSFYLATTKASAGPTSVGVKIGTKLVPGEILGPVCYDANTASVVEQKVQLDLFKDPDRVMYINQDPGGNLLSVSAYDGNQGAYVPVQVKDLKTFPVWVCVYPVLVGDEFSYCGVGPDGEPGMLPITHMPDGVGRFGVNTCYAAFIAGRYAYYCY